MGKPLFQAMVVGSLLLLTAVSWPAHTEAASCCGGASVSEPFALPKWNDSLVGLSLQHETTFGARGQAGERLPVSNWAMYEQRVVVGGAYRLAKDWQAGLALPLVHRTMSAGGLRTTGTGLGDVGLSVRYEIMDEETCFAMPFHELTPLELKPSIHWVTRGSAPTGRAMHRSTDALGADVTGTGLWSADTGVEIMKVWGVLATGGEILGGYQTGIAENGHQISPPALRWQTGASVLFYPRYQRYLGISVLHRRELFRTLASAFDVEATSAYVVGSVADLPGGLWLRGAVGQTGVWQGRNIPVGWSAQVTAIKLF
jgi:hypothetical protein